MKPYLAGVGTAVLSFFIIYLFYLALGNFIPNTKATIPVKPEVRVLKTDLNKIRAYMDSIENDNITYDSIYFYIKFKKK